MPILTKFITKNTQNYAVISPKHWFHVFFSYAISINNVLIEKGTNSGAIGKDFVEKIQKNGLFFRKMPILTKFITKNTQNYAEISPKHWFHVFFSYAISINNVLIEKGTNSGAIGKDFVEKFKFYSIFCRKKGINRK